MIQSAFSICFSFIVIVGINAQIIQSKQSEPNSEEILREAILDFDGKRFEKCLQSLNNAIAINHNGELSDILFYYRALTYLKIDEDDNALSDLDTAISFNNQKIHYFELRLELYMRSLKFNNALADIDKILSLNPDNEIALLNKGIILQQSGEIQNAFILYSKILSFNAQNREALYLRGMIYLQNAMADKGCVDIQLSANMNYKPAAEALSRYCR